MDGFPWGIPSIEPIPWTDRAPHTHTLWTPSCLTKGPFTTNNTVVRRGCCLSCVQSSCSLWVLCWDTWKGRWSVSRLTLQILLMVPSPKRLLSSRNPCFHKPTHFSAVESGEASKRLQKIKALFGWGLSEHHYMFSSIIPHHVICTLLLYEC